MEWKKEFETGVKSIDHEHHKLVTMITKLQNSLKDGFITAMTGQIIKEIVEYTKEHFASEELVMEKINYPGLEEHKKMHRDLIDHVVKMLMGLKVGEQVTSLDLIDFLKNWLRDHILKEDKKIGEYYRKVEEAAISDSLE